MPAAPSSYSLPSESPGHSQAFPSPCLISLVFLYNMLTSLMFKTLVYMVMALPSLLDMMAAQLCPVKFTFQVFGMESHKVCHVMWHVFLGGLSLSSSKSWVSSLSKVLATHSSEVMSLL